MMHFRLAFTLVSNTCNSRGPWWCISSTLCWVFDPAPGKPLVHQPATQNHCLNQPDLRQTDKPPFSHGLNEGYNDCSTDTYFSTQLSQGFSLCKYMSLYDPFLIVPLYSFSHCLFIISFSLSLYGPSLIVSLCSLSHCLFMILFLIASLWSHSYCRFMIHFSLSLYDPFLIVSLWSLFQCLVMIPLSLSRYDPFLIVSYDPFLIVSLWSLSHCLYMIPFSWSLYDPFLIASLWSLYHCVFMICFSMSLYDPFLNLSCFPCSLLWLLIRFRRYRVSDDIELIQEAK